MSIVSKRLNIEASRLVAKREQRILNEALRSMGPKYNIGVDSDLPEQDTVVPSDDFDWRYFIPENTGDFFSMANLLAKSHVATWEEPRSDGPYLNAADRYADIEQYAHVLMGAGGRALRATGVAVVDSEAGSLAALQQVSVEISGSPLAIVKKSLARERVYVSGAGGVEVIDPTEYERRSIEANAILQKVARVIGAGGINLYLGKSSSRQQEELEAVLAQGFKIVGEQSDSTYGEIIVARMAVS